jgi:hypothetical protein
VLILVKTPLGVIVRKAAMMRAVERAHAGTIPQMRSGRGPTEIPTIFNGGDIEGMPPAHVLGQRWSPLRSATLVDLYGPPADSLLSQGYPGKS